MTVPKCSASRWLPALAAARPQQPGSDAQGDRADRAVVQLSPPVPSSSAVAGLLLQAFVDSTAPQARTREAHPLPRSLEISVVGGAAAVAAGASAAAEQPAEQQFQQQAAPLVVQFAATDEAADMQQVEQAARLFEAYWSMHTKAAKSDLHCRMRRRLAALGQQLALQRFDSRT
ncbi:hydantoin utilization A [Chlorella sorokiniana]|uniref:Hydantoin utilization A n=1 Tax=Chlorella sorokiniana TaxID=3076 RepID=A0A2P6TQ20_CHLSO|nr:hydantoin utilization A [Chlorella sorokiniana]|eukprot:PRW56122.1 hydantoin utilization A [Chlorella sorokiniana]